MVFFIPWRVVAEESGAAHFGFGGAMPARPARAGAAAAGGAVADFHLVIFRFGATMELGRSERTDDAAAVELRGRRRQHP